MKGNKETDFTTANTNDSKFVAHIHKFTNKVPTKIYQDKDELGLKLEQEGFHTGKIDQILYSE